MDDLCSTLNMTRKIIFSDPNSFDINYQFDNKLSSDDLEQMFNNFCSSVKKEIDNSFISAILMCGDGCWGGTAISVDWIPMFVNK